jgi:hypothetical protein
LEDENGLKKSLISSNLGSDVLNLVQQGLNQKIVNLALEIEKLSKNDDSKAKNRSRNRSGQKFINQAKIEYKTQLESRLNSFETIAQFLNYSLQGQNSLQNFMDLVNELQVEETKNLLQSTAKSSIHTQTQFKDRISRINLDSLSSVRRQLYQNSHDSTHKT